jgi:uncharacterized membrane protein YccC
MKVPGLQDWVFSLKTFTAAMLALYIAFWLDLPRPYWAMATVYIASQPYSGATRSKALFRALGTLIGAAGAVALVPLLVNAPELLSLALALWVGTCLYISLQDRTPRSYVAMLAGYSIAIIAFPTVNDPGTIFDVALARVQEIMVGIVTASVVTNLVFPRAIAPLVAARIQTWLQHARGWAYDALAGRIGGPVQQAARWRLASDAIEIDLLASQLAYDTSVQREMTPWVRLLRMRMLMLLPVLSSVSDRLTVLRAAPAGLPAGLQAVMARLTAWLQAGEAAGAEQLRADIDALQPALQPRSGWPEIVLASLLLRLRDTVDVAEDCRRLQLHVASGNTTAAPVLNLQEADGATQVRHKDRFMALLSAGAVMVAMLLCCLFWISTGWADGFVAVEMAAVVPSFFATQDNPLPGIRSFLIWSVVAVFVDMAYLFAILPAISDFEILIMVLAPPFLAFGLLAANPATAFIGLALAANGATLLALQSTYNADFTSFVNSGIALVLGMAVAGAVVAVMRTVGAEWSAGRLIRAGWASLADAAAGYGRQDRAAFAGLMLDRLGLAVPRLAASGPDGERRGAELLTDLRIGLNIVDLRRARRELQPAASGGVTQVLDGLAGHFRACTQQRRALTPGADLLGRIDLALATVAADIAGPGQRDALLGLVGIRRGLFPDAASYLPPPEPGIETVRHAA